MNEKIYKHSPYQHGSSQIEFVKELRDKYMDFEHVCYVFLFHVPKHIYKPFEMLMRWANP